MQINWYVITGEDHLGPFSEDVLRQLFEAGDIEADTKIWQEGMDNPIDYSSIMNARSAPIEDDSEIEDSNVEIVDLPSEEDEADLPPDLPPLPSSDEENSIDQNSLNEASGETSGEASFEDSYEDELEEDLQKIQEERDNILRPDFGKEDPTKNVIIIEDEEDYDLLSEGVFSHSFKKALRNLVLTLLLFVISGYGYMYYKTYSGSFTRPAKMSLNDFRQVQAVAKNVSNDNKFTFTISDDKTRVWLVTNNPYVGRVVLKMKSLTNKILSSKDIELSSTGILKGKIAEFSQFEFQKGQNLVDGYYEIEVLTPTKLDVPFIAKFFPQRNRQFRFIDQVLITSMNSSEFDRVLKDFNNSKARNDIVFWEELSQKYKTLKAITVQIKNSISNIFQLNKDNWVENVAAFEKTYLTKYGTYFTNFVVENDQAYDKYKNQDFTNKQEVISHYTRLSRLAKDVGRISINSLNNLKLYGDINNDVKTRSLRRLVTRPFDSIIKDCDEKIKFIQTK